MKEGSVPRVLDFRLRIAEKGHHEEHEGHERGSVLRRFVGFVSFVVISPYAKSEIGDHLSCSGGLHVLT
jgi:hypothetical protein